MWGTPARPLKQHLEQLANLARLPDLRRELAELKRRLAELERKRLMLVVVGGHSRNIGKTSVVGRPDPRAARVTIGRPSRSRSTATASARTTAKPAGARPMPTIPSR